DAVSKYQQAGKIAAKVREEMKRTTIEGMPIIRICEKAENMIRRMGGKPAFPCNVSVNEVAAHYTSPPGDESVVPEGAIVKIDVGVHVDGYIADTATTVYFNSEYEGMVQASEAALETAVKLIRPGLSTSQLGSEIQKVIERHGFRPISNLTGHQIGRYVIHTGKSLPNVSHFSVSKIREGDVYAIEPFVTVKEATGRVENGPKAYIFRLVKRKSQRQAEAKRLLKYIEARFRTLPFAERWLREYGSRQEYRSALSDLVASKCVLVYSVFVEASRKYVAQSEHTVYVDKDGAIVLT
ncbi:MAG: type II methionyl aminopeptidase, partial [Candidatus Bathyarchaeota archaeon]|nr:type II methionyl aminopeptidase [Candidatus Bathyarchaeota archaeon]